MDAHIVRRGTMETHPVERVVPIATCFLPPSKQVPRVPPMDGYSIAITNNGRAVPTDRVHPPIHRRVETNLILYETTKHTMIRSVKYAVLDYERATGDRLTDFRRHVNTHLIGGGHGQSTARNPPFTPKGTEDAKAIVQMFEHTFCTLSHDEIRIQKNKYGLPSNRRLPCEPPHPSFTGPDYTWEQVTQDLIQHQIWKLPHSHQPQPQLHPQPQQSSKDKEEDDISMDEEDDPSDPMDPSDPQIQRIVDVASSTATTPDDLETDQERAIVHSIVNYLDQDEQKKKQFKYMVLLSFMTKPSSPETTSLYTMFQHAASSWIQRQMTLKTAAKVFGILVQMYHRRNV